jgi:WD40 repeat protein
VASRQRLVQVNVGNGVRLINEGQLFASLPWLVEALRLEQGHPEGEELQRRRIGAVLNQCPKLTQVFSHEAPVNCAAFSPDSRYVATGTGRIVNQIMIDKNTLGQAQVWDVDTGERVGRLMVHGGSISQLRYSPDGRWIATASADGTARVWDANSGLPLTSPLPHSNSVVKVVFSRDGTHPATASLDNTARVWEAGARIRRESQ